MPSTVLTPQSLVPPSELLRALHRVGRGFNHRAKWFALFLNADLSELTTEDAERWGYDIVAFTLGDPRDEHLDRAWCAMTVSPYVIPRPASERVESTLLPEVRREVRETWAELREYVDGLLDGRSDVPPLYNGRAAFGVQRYPDGTTRFVIVGSAKVAFLAAVGQLLAALGPKLHRCDPEGGCPRIVAAVGHWRYCSPQHAQRARMRRFLEGQGGKRRQAKNAPMRRASNGLQSHRTTIRRSSPPRARRPKS